MLSPRNDTHMIFLLNILRHGMGTKGGKFFLLCAHVPPTSKWKNDRGLQTRTKGCPIRSSHMNIGTK